MSAGNHTSASSKATAVALGAFLLWGLLPLYWKGLSSVNAVEVLCHRISWSFLTLIPLVLFTGRGGEVLRVFKDRKSLLTLLLSSVTLAFNWGIYIWAVSAGHVLDSSLGYYITPLLNMMMGVFLFKERPSALAWAAIALAAVGVGYQILTLGRFPWVALAVGGSFSLYSLLRKVVMVESLPGLFVETGTLTPLAVGFIIFQAMQGNTAFARGSLTLDALLVGSGIVTTIPLIAFAFGARRIPMTTLGLLQYITPSMAFLMGAFVFKEPLNINGLITFALIWTALVLYTYDNLKRHWQAKNRQKAQPEKAQA